MNYGALISEAFRITLRNRYLWLFGLFAGTGSSFNFPSGGGSGGDGGGFDPGSFDPNNLNPGSLGPTGAGVPPGAGIAAFWLQEAPPVLLFVLLGILALLVILFFVAATIISNGGLAGSVAAIHRGERRGFGPTFRAGVGVFWRVLGQAIVLFLISLAFLLVIGVPVGLAILAVFTGTQSEGARIGVTILVVLVAILLAVLVFVPLYIIGQLALRSLVVGREGITGSIGRSFRLFRRNPGRSLLVWLIYVAVSIGVGIAMLIVFLLLGLILLGPAIALFVTGSNTAGVVAAVAGGLLFLIPALVLSGAVGTFNHTYWTLAYLQLTEPPPVPSAVGGEPGYPPTAGTATI